MTTVRQITLSESMERWAESCRRSETEWDPDEAVECYGRYADEGHLVVLTWVGDAGPDEAWFVHCAACKDNAWGMSADEMLAFVETDGFGGSAKPGPFWLNFGQARLWADDHRAEHGLERQKYVPASAVGNGEPEGRAAAT